MKKLFMIGLIVFFAWSYYTKNNNSDIVKILPQFSDVIKPSSRIKKHQPTKFTCDGRQHCSQMRSYEEAKFFIDNCPNTKMDGDHDGIPCERQFKRRS